METVAGNRVIAEFMGYKFNAYPDLKHNNITKPNETEWYYASWDLVDFEEQIKKDLQYHTSWDWQIPAWVKVVKLLHKLACNGDINKDEYIRLLDRYEISVSQNKPDDGQQILVESIQWYNQNNTGCLKQKA